MSGGGAPPGGRLIVVWSADPARGYAWLPAARAGDVVVAPDPLAADDLAARRPLCVDGFDTWEERSEGELRVEQIVDRVRADPEVAGLELAGHRLIDLAGYRLRTEIARLLRGWALAAALGPADEVACGPDAPPALVMGLRAGLGLDAAAVVYRAPPEVPGSRLARAAIRPVARMLTVVSNPARARVAVVVAGKLVLALDALPRSELRAAGVAAMPFPGLDHGNSVAMALRRGLPILNMLGAGHARSRPAVGLPERLAVSGDSRLDRAITVMAGRLLDGVAAELAGAAAALRKLERASALRALVLPTGALGSARLLTAWAHARGIRVGVVQHGVYAHRQFDGGDRLADVVFAWGDRTGNQINGWPAPRPRPLTVGVPGVKASPPRASPSSIRTALVATSNAVETPIVPAGFCESFIDTVAAGLARLRRAGVGLRLRPHPAEDPRRYERMLARYGLEVPVVRSGPFMRAMGGADVVISSCSSAAFEAAAIGVPVLMWLGPAPTWLRERHLVEPWVAPGPGGFERAEEFEALVEGLVARPADGLEAAARLSARLARYARPFEPLRFAEGLRMLAA